jgi:hypothetical protein
MMAVFWDALIVLIMDAVRASETSVNVYQTTRRNIPEDSHIQAKINLPDRNVVNDVFIFGPSFIKNDMTFMPLEGQPNPIF